MNRVLVTGGSGFIGRAALAALDPALFEIHATYLNHPPQAGEGINWHRLQIFDSAATGDLVRRLRPTHLLHLAWYMRERDHLVVAENLQWVRATLALTEAFVAAGGRRAVYSGTYAEYGVAEGVMDEVAQCSPVSLYATCKDALHRIVRAYAPPAGLSYAWTRIFTVYGPADAPYRLVPYAIASLLKGEEVIATEGRQIRDFIHSSDVGTALVALLRSDEQGAFNIGSGEGHAVRDVLSTIAELLDARSLLRLGAREQSPGETQLITASVERLKALGWSPKYDLRSGLQDSIAHCMGHQ